MFIGDDDNKPLDKATIKESKDLLHRLIRQQAIDTREDYTSAVLAINRVTPYRNTDPEVAEILKALERTFSTMPPFGEFKSLTERRTTGI
jgi:hypothetical protein